MQKIIEDIKSPEWWFSVVAVAMLVGLVGVYLVRFLDVTGKRAAEMFASRGRRSRKKRALLVRRYTNHSQTIPFLLAIHQAYHNYMLGLMSCAILSMGVGTAVRVLKYTGMGAPYLSTIMLAFGMLSWIFALVSLQRASDYMLVMIDVERRLILRRSPRVT